MNTIRVESEKVLLEYELPVSGDEERLGIRSRYIRNWGLYYSVNEFDERFWINADVGECRRLPTVVAHVGPIISIGWGYPRIETRCVVPFATSEIEGCAFSWQIDRKYILVLVVVAVDCL